MVGACASSNMFREMEKELESEKANCYPKSARFGDAKAPTVGRLLGMTERNPYILCWTDSQHWHYKPLSPLTHI